MRTSTVDPPKAPARELFADLPHHKSKHRYSVRRALSMAADADMPTGLEAEVSREITLRSGRSPRGIWLPWDANASECRTLGVGASAGFTGSGSVQTAIPPATLWDVLRAKMILKRMGAKVGNFLGADKGRLALPVKKSASVISWVQEGSPAPSESNMTIGQALLDPHTATAYTDCTRWMEKLGAEGFENFIVDDLVQSVAVAVDQAGLNGLGINNQPIGLFQMPNWPTLKFAADSGNGGKPDYDTLVALEETAGQNCADTGTEVRMGWVTSPQGRSALRRCDLGGSTVTGRYAWKAHPCYDPISGELRTIESVLGHPAVTTTNVPANLVEGTGQNLTPVAIGNFAHVVVQLWGAADVLRDPYKQSSLGVVRYRVYQDCDVAFMYPGVSFALAFMLTS